MCHCEADNHPSSGCEEITSGHIHLNLLGVFCLCSDNQPVIGIMHPRLQHLLAYLVLHRAKPISRQQLAFLFWPDSTDQQALKNLRTMLTRLRHVLPGVDCLINITAQAIHWRSDVPFTLDVARFEAAMAQATAVQDAATREAGGYDETVKALEAAVALYTGELLPGCYDDWILPLREQYHQAYGDALERLVLLLEEHRKYTSALPYARRLLSHDTLREAAYHSLIRLHLALGDRTEAARVCRSCENMLEREFGTTLPRAIRDRYERLIKAENQPVLETMEQLVRVHSSTLPLVGRDTEWSELLAAWRSAETGHPQMVLISGEAGMGKTRLAEELCAWVARQGVDVIAAHCYPAGTAPVAYAPVAEWLRDQGLKSRLAILDDVWLVEVSRILPTLLLDRPHLKSPGPLTEPWQRMRLFEALARAVLGPEDQVPLLLFLDDLQWCDQETLDWLGYLLRFAARAPLLIVAAVRKYEIDQVHPLMAFWFALTRSGLLREISLSPLDAAETSLLAAKIVRRAIEEREAALIYQRSEGNPLFVVEMVRAEITGGGHSIEDSPDITTSLPIQSSPAAFPPKVRAVIQWRLTRLSPAGQALTQTAAVIGRQFSFEVLARASGQNKEAVMAGLDELWQHHIVRTQGSDIYDFSHDGIRAVAYDNMSPIRRHVIHLHVAQALEELHRDELDTFSTQIASHYEQAGQNKSAITFYRQAAALAESVYANTEAARLYQHLIESELSRNLSRLEKCTIMLALAEVWQATGQWVRAETISRNALVEAEALGDICLIARSKRDLADVLHRLGYYDASMQRLAEAEQGFQAAGDLRGLESTLRIAGEIHWLRGNHTAAFSALERQLEIANQVNDQHSICQALGAMGMVLWSQGDWERAADHCLKSILIAAPLDYKPLLTRASITLGNIRAGEHWFGEAVYWYLHAGTLAREIDDRQALSWAIYNIALILLKRGDFERARAGFELSLHKSWEIGDRWSACLNFAGLAVVQERLGNVERAEALYRQAIDLGRDLSISSYLSGMLLGLAQFLLEQGRAVEASSVYEEALAQISSVTGERLAGEDTRFDARVLGIRLRHVLGVLTAVEAAAVIHTLMKNSLLGDADEPTRKAALNYALWRIMPEHESARSAAAAGYRAEYTETGAEVCRRRYQELTGEMLPDPPPLPDVSDLIPDQLENLSISNL